MKTSTIIHVVQLLYFPLHISTIELSKYSTLFDDVLELDSQQNLTILKKTYNLVHYYESVNCWIP